jgi:1,4-dihydroxy-2-naphthoate octaprenyltransferase
MADIWLNMADVKTRQLLWTAHDGEQQPWVAQELNNDQLRFTLGDTVQPSAFKIWFQAVRAISLTATATPALAVLCWLAVRGQPIDFMMAGSALLGVLCLQMAVNLLNDVSDYLKLIDLPGTLGGSGVIQQGWRSAQQIQHAAYVCLLAGVCFGLPVVLFHPALWLIAICAIGGVLLYSAQSWGLKYRALGDLAVWLLCGPLLTIGISLAATGDWQIEVIWLGSFFGFTACAILHSNNLNDINADTQRGAITLAALQGFRLARFWLFFYYIAAFVSLVPVLWQAPAASAVLLSLLALLPLLRKLFLAQEAHSPLLNEIRFDTAKFHLLSGVLLIVGLLFAR